jgi:hypothetical protein
MAAAYVSLYRRLIEAGSTLACFDTGVSLGNEQRFAPSLQDTRKVH